MNGNITDEQARQLDLARQYYYGHPDEACPEDYCTENLLARGFTQQEIDGEGFRKHYGIMMQFEHMSRMVEE